MRLNDHDITLNTIKNALKYVQTNIGFQKDLFHKENSNKKYTGRRNDKGYSKWRLEVLKRFNSSCCVCMSDYKVVCHHLYSYKYYPDLRTNIDNGVCLCNSCHELFNDCYSNVNTLDQFLEFRELMRDNEINSYIKKSCKIYNCEDFINGLENCNIKFKVIRNKFPTIIIADIEDESEIYCGAKEL